MPVGDVLLLHKHAFRFSRREQAFVSVQQQCVLRPSRTPLGSELIHKADQEGKASSS